jgi:hypothetical protein
MIYKNIFPSNLLILFLILLAFQAKGQGPDSVYTVPNTPFLSHIIAAKNLNTAISLSKETYPIPLENTVIAANGQLLLKQGASIYVLIRQTGFVYQLIRSDSLQCFFKRIDHTVNLNYNIDCKNFMYKGGLYSYGGYGFWKTNGHLRKFNFEDSEWDIIPLNMEIMSTSYVWFDEEQGRLYVPFQRVVNAGIAGPENIRGVPTYTSYYLDLKTNQWVKLGELEKDVIKIVEKDFSSNEFLTHKNGYIHLVNEDTYFFDLVHNKIYKSKSAQLNQFLIRRASNYNLFMEGDNIVSYNPGNQLFVTYPLKLSDFELLRTSIWGQENKVFIFLLIIIVIALVFTGGWWIFNRSVSRKLEVAQLKILKSKTVNQAFTAIEVALIKLLLSASSKDKHIEIGQINHVLGIKDKNIGLQKKVRSDVMKAINDKYEFITQSNSPLIGSSRKEEDKRFYEYFIKPSELNTIKRILENN